VQDRRADQFVSAPLQIEAFDRARIFITLIIVVQTPPGSSATAAFVEFTIAFVGTLSRSWGPTLLLVKIPLPVRVI
jgi:hypothetical protein